MDGLDVVPRGVITWITPSLTAAGARAINLVSETGSKSAFTPANVTDVAPVKPVPDITTDVPAGPLVGTAETILKVTLYGRDPAAVPVAT